MNACYDGKSFALLSLGTKRLIQLSQSEFDHRFYDVNVRVWLQLYQNTPLSICSLCTYVSRRVRRWSLYLKGVNGVSVLLGGNAIELKCGTTAVDELPSFYLRQNNPNVVMKDVFGFMSEKAGGIASD